MKIKILLFFVIGHFAFIGAMVKDLKQADKPVLSAKVEKAQQTVKGILDKATKIEDLQIGNQTLGTFTEFSANASVAEINKVLADVANIKGKPAVGKGKPTVDPTIAAKAGEYAKYESIIGEIQRTKGPIIAAANAGSVTKIQMGAIKALAEAIIKAKL